MLITQASHDTKLRYQEYLINSLISLLIQMNQQWLVSILNANLILILIIIHEHYLLSFLVDKSVSRVLLKIYSVYSVYFSIVYSHDWFAYHFLVYHVLVVAHELVSYLLHFLKNIYIGYNLVTKIYIENIHWSANIL